MDGEPVTLASVQAGRGCRLALSWGLGNELHVVDLHDLASTANQSESTASVVQWGALSAGQRRIAYDSLGCYQQLHQAAAEPLSPEAWGQAARYSKTVSAILAADGVRGAEATPEELATLHERALWELLALFFLGSSGSSAGGPQGTVAQDLARWLRSSSVAVAGGVAAAPLPPALAASLREAALPEASPQYWPCLARLVALGWIEEAIELLGLHSAWLRYDGSEPGGGGDEAARAAVSALEAATLLLRRFPSLEAPGAPPPPVGRSFSAPSEFQQYRRTWQAQAAALAGDARLWGSCEAAGEDTTAAGLRSVLAVLSGEEGALAGATANWLELLVAQLLHVYPAARPQAELRQLLQRCFDAGGGASAPEFLQVAAAALEACCELDAQAAMRVCSAFCSDWFMAHAPDLLAAHPAGAAVLPRELPHLGGSQVEFYSLEYAASLMPHTTTWPLAASYLAWCPAHGQAALEALLRRLPLDAANPWPARKAAQVAAYHGLAHTEQDVHRAQGVLCWQAGQPGAALSWLARCADVSRIDVVLAPLAAAISAGGAAAEDQAAALEALQPLLECLPSGSANAALLAVHRLLKQGGGSNSGAGGGMHAAVAALAQLPEAMRDSCLQLVCGALPAMPPGTLGERDVAYLLQWLLSAEARLPVGIQRDGAAAAAAASIQVARLALVRFLAASHMQQGWAQGRPAQQQLLGTPA